MPHIRESLHEFELGQDHGVDATFEVIVEAATETMEAESCNPPRRRQ